MVDYCLLLMNIFFVINRQCWELCHFKESDCESFGHKSKTESTEIKSDESEPHRHESKSKFTTIKITSPIPSLGARVHVLIKTPCLCG